jgi:tetratricopeptide (TPR) repeat protein
LPLKVIHLRFTKTPRLFLGILVCCALGIGAAGAESPAAEREYQAGVAALEKGDLGLALDAFEKTVLLDPRHAGAWLDLAIVYHRLGETSTALQILSHVEENFSPRQDLLSQIRAVRAMLATAPSRNADLPQPGWAMQISSHLGWVKNANLGLSTLSFSLTPADSLPVPVTVADSARPRSDSALLLRGQAYRAIEHAGGARSEVLAALGLRSYQNQRNYNQNDAALWWLTSWRAGPVQWQVGPGIRLLRQGDSTLGGFYTLQAAAQVNGWAGCRWGPLLEKELRDYRQQGYVDSDTHWLGGQFRCEAQRFSWLSSLRLGLDRPRGQRPGGQTQKAELQLQGRARLAADWSLEASFLLGHYRDDQGFSPLLLAGQRRWIERAIGRVGLDWRASSLGQPALYLNAYLESIEDRSNIALSKLADTQAFVGIRREF